MKTEHGKRRISIDALIAGAAHQAPPLELDPAARLLGLVAEQAHHVDGAALKAARMRASLSVPELANRLRSDGWKVTSADAFRWETRSTASVAPELLVAIALAVGVTPERIAQTAPRSRAGITELEGFKGLVERWAKLFDLPLSTAAESLLARASATVHRGDEQDDAQTLRSLEMLVTDLEDRGSQ